jgi:hypothetical protein
MGDSMDNSNDNSKDYGTNDPIEHHGGAESARPARGQTPPMHPIDEGAPQVLPVGRNTLGVVSLVLGALGFLCLPLVGPLGGLVCGIMGARREPRGVAIAGIVVSSLGVLAGCVVVPLLVALTLPALAAGRKAAQHAQNTAVGLDAIARLESATSHGEAAPESLDEVYGSEPQPVDAWGTPLRLEKRMVDEADAPPEWNPGEPVYLIWSAGSDTIWDTPDDCVVASKPPDAALQLGLPQFGW